MKEKAFPDARYVSKRALTSLLSSAAWLLLSMPPPAPTPPSESPLRPAAWLSNAVFFIERRARAVVPPLSSAELSSMVCRMSGSSARVRGERVRVRVRVMVMVMVRVRCEM